MDSLHAVIYGIVEGITEFLPISSTAHLLLTAHLLGDNSDFQKSFSIAIQLGAILAVVVLYARSLIVEWPVMLRVGLAFLPTGILALLLYKVVRTYLLASIPTMLWALALGGIVMILFERLHRERPNAILSIKEMPLLHAFIIGVCQAFALVPGVSRAAATVLAGMALGVSRKAAVEFSFLLAIPTIAAATGKVLFDEGAGFSSEQVGALALGFISSFVAALAAIVWLLRFLQSHSFQPFGYYRIAVAAGFAAWLFFGA